MLKDELTEQMYIVFNNSVIAARIWIDIQQHC